MHMDLLQIAVFLVLGLALAISVVTDLKVRKIKNIVTYPTVVLCLLLRLAQAGWGGPMGPGLAGGLVGLAVGGGLFFLLALSGGMKMGDVKLMAAVGAAVGFPMVLACLTFVGLVGGVEALVVLVWKRRLLGTLRAMVRPLWPWGRAGAEVAPAAERIWIPYGVAIALGTVWGVVWSWQQVHAASL